MKSEFGIIGLGVMGKSLARNFANKGFKLALYNRHVSGTEEHVAASFIEEFQELKDCQGFDDLEAFAQSLETPRKILIMVNAGTAVDNVIIQLLKYIAPDDILIDGGNSHYKNTKKRHTLLSEQKIHFIGMGVSGGEEGALNGPSLMPGGNKKAYSLIEKYVTAIAAKDTNGTTCCQYIGKEGAGHFVKMVHNGIEYAEMQLIAEIYALLRFKNNLEPNEITTIFKDWNTSSLKNYLLESTAVILNKKEGDTFLIDLVLDKASHKGTGSWTTIAAAELGVPFTMGSAALNARYISALKERRTALSKAYISKNDTSKPIDIDTLKGAYQVARIVNHHQGFQLIHKASLAYHWDIDLNNVASVWTNGCIIASSLIDELTHIQDGNTFILSHDGIIKTIQSHRPDLKTTVISAVESDIPAPCLSESLSFLNAISQASGTGNIIQAQRDYFGAHTYKRIDDPNGASHHTNWNN